MMIRQCLLFCILLFYVTLTAGSLQKEIETIIRNSPYGKKTIGVLVKDIENDSVLAAVNRHTLFVPASVMKLITGAAAFELLGPRYRYKTDVYIPTKSFDVDSGVVPGDLYIRGSGDPGFYAEQLWLFVQSLSHRGIKQIRGDLVLDDFCFDSVITGPGFNEDNSSFSYEAPTAALSANFNTVAVHVAPGKKVGDPVRITPFPAIKGVKIISTAKTTAPGQRSQLKVKTEIMDGRTAILVFGNMNRDERPRYKFRKVWSTWENFGWMLQALFGQCGITFTGGVRHEPVPLSVRSEKPFYTHTSKPLPEFIFNMFKYSSNFAAEMLFKTIASQHDTLPASWESAAGIVDRWWKEKKFSTSTFPVIVNGSGMGDENRLSPAHIAALLEYVLYKKEYFPEFMSALSVAGVDGTLSDRFNNSPLSGILRGKTGTLNDRGVSNLVGYILLPEKTLLFAIFINNKKYSQIDHWDMQKKILEAVIAPVEGNK